MEPDDVESRKLNDDEEMAVQDVRIAIGEYEFSLPSLCLDRKDLPAPLQCEEERAHQKVCQIPQRQALRLSNWLGHNGADHASVFVALQALIQTHRDSIQKTLFVVSVLS